MFDDSAEALDFVNARDAEPLAEVGTSCPDHFLRTRIKPLLGGLGPGRGHDRRRCRTRSSRGRRAVPRRTTPRTTRRSRRPTSPQLRDPNPSVVVVPGVGLFGFGKDRREAGYTAEFYRNAIHVMAGASALGGGRDGARGRSRSRRARRRRRASRRSTTTSRCRAARRSASSTWALEEAKLQRMPPPKEFSRRVCVVVGGGSGIGRAAALKAAALGAHVVVADRNEAAAKRSGERGRRRPAGRRRWSPCAVDITDRESIRAMLQRRGPPFRRRRHPGHQHRRHLPDAGSRGPHHRRAVAVDA